MPDKHFVNGHGKPGSINSMFPAYPGHVAEAYRSSGIWTSDTVVSCIERWAVATPDKHLVEAAGGVACTYREMADLSLQLANSYLRIGLRKGDVIAIQLPSCLEFLLAYVAAARIGAVLATTHMPYREAELEPLLRFAEAKAVICARETDKYEGPAMMQRLRQCVPHIGKVIVVGGDADGQADCHNLAALIESGRRDPIKDPPSASDPALLCFTSGTSSTPKGVMHSFETLTANARHYSGVIDLTDADKAVVTPPFTHIFGLECFHNCITTGGTLVPVEQYTPHAFVEILESLAPTVVYAAPAHLAGTLKAIDLDGCDLGSIRQVILGGSICPPQVAADFEAHLPNGRVGNLFGMTEVLVTMQTPMHASPQVRHGTIGRPVPGIEARIVGDDLRPVRDGQVGELQIRGFSVMSGYVKNPEATASAFTEDGWYRSGDLGCWDDGGNIVIVGRKKDLINRGGVKINPSDIENILAEHDDVVHAALVPMADDVLGERICAFVTVVEGAHADLETLCSFLAERGVAKMRWPERVVVIDEMPMTPTRKIIKGALVEQLRNMTGEKERQAP